MANLAISNTGTSAINGWTLGFTFPGDQKVTSSWNATVAQNGETVAASTRPARRQRGELCPTGGA